MGRAPRWRWVRIGHAKRTPEFATWEMRQKKCYSKKTIGDVGCPPTPFLWQAPASTQKPKKGKPGRPFFGARGGGGTVEGHVNCRHVPCMCCQTSRRRVGRWQHMAHDGNGLLFNKPTVLEFRLSHHCTAGLERAPCPLPSLLSPDRRPSPCWQGDGRAAQHKRNSPWSSGPVASWWRYMFLCFCQLSNSWRLHLF